MEAPNTRTTRGGASIQSQTPEENTTFATLTDCSAKFSSLRRLALVEGGNLSGNFFSHSRKTRSSALVESGRPSDCVHHKDINSLALKRSR